MFQTIQSTGFIACVWISCAPQFAGAQGAPAVLEGSVEAYRATIRDITPYIPDAPGASLSLQRIVDGKTAKGTQGIPYVGVKVKENQYDHQTTSTFEILQVIDEDNVLITSYRRQVVWLVMPTDDLIDGQPLDLSRQLFEYIGTKRYTNARRTSTTVPCLEFRRAATMADLLGMEIREWKDDSGKFSIRAQFVKYERGEVSLQDSRTSKLDSVPLKRLSREDQSYVRRTLREQKTKARR